jgi:hypothetical protein
LDNGWENNVSSHSRGERMSGGNSGACLRKK